MYCLTDEQVAYILNDIRRNGVEMEDLQLNLLDHICCKVEQEFKEGDDFERFYKQAVREMCRGSLQEIEEETINLLKFKNYYFMKKAMIISAAFSVVSFLSGCFFKLMYWPGASVLLLLGIVSMSLVFLPLAVLLKGKEPSTSGTDKMVLATGAATGILYAMATLFTIMHWPNSRMLWFSTMVVSFLLFIPSYFFTGIRRPEKKMNTIFTSVLLIGATGLIFTMLRVRNEPPVGMYGYFKNEQILRTIQHNHMPTEELAVQVNSICAQMKAMVIQEETGQAALPDDLRNPHVTINEHNTGNLMKEGKGADLLHKLKVAVSNYNAATDEQHRIPVDYSLLDMPVNKLDEFTPITILNNLTQVQIYVTVNSQKTTVACNQ